MSATPVSSVTVPAVPPALGGDTGDPLPATVVHATPDLEAARISAVLESIVPTPAVPPAPDDDTVDTPPAAVAADEAGAEEVATAPNKPVVSAEGVPPGLAVVSGASVASAAVSPPVPTAPPDKQLPHAGAGYDDPTLGPLDRALLNELDELRKQAQDLHDHSRSMKHHKKLCFTLGDKAAAVVSNIIPPFDCVLFRTDIALDSEILFEKISKLFTKIEESNFFKRRQQSKTTTSRLEEYSTKLQILLDRIKGGPDTAVDLTNATKETFSSDMRLSAKTVAYEGFKTLTAGLVNMADGLPWPWKAVPQTVLQIIKHIEKIGINSETCNELIAQAHKLAKAVATIVQRNAQHHPDVGEFVDELTSVLQETMEILQTLSKKSKLAPQEVESRISKQKTKLDMSMHLYLIKVTTWLSVQPRIVERKMVPIIANMSSLPPPPAQVFLGRNKDLHTYTQAILTSPSARLGILGTGGIGKTTLATMLLHHAPIVAAMSDRRYFISCEGVSDASSLAAHLCRCLGIDSQHKDPLVVVRDYFCGPQALLVLDNFETVWTGSNMVYAEELLQHLVTIDRLHLVITMRGSVLPLGIPWSIPPAESLLQPLTPEDAAASFWQFAQRSVDAHDEPTLKQLLHEIDCIPLAINLLAQLFSAGQSLPSLLQQWNKQKTAILQTDADSRHHNVELSIQLSISHISSSSSEAILLLQLCSHLPDGLFPVIGSFLSARFINFAAASYLLERFAIAYKGRFRELCLLNPIRYYVQRQYPMLPQNLLHALSQAHCCLAVLSNQPLNLYFPAIVASLQPQMANLTAVLGQSLQTQMLQSDKLIKAAVSLGWFSVSIVPDRVLPSKLLDYAQNTGDRLVQARCTQLMGRIEYMLDNYDTAKHLLWDASTMFSEIGNPLRQAQCTELLGDIEYLLNNYDTAKDLLRDASTIFAAIGDRLGQAQCTRSLGDIELMLQNYDTAKDLLRDASTMFTDIGDRLGLAQCTQSLGDIERMLNNYDTAKDLFRDASTMFIDIGDRLGQAQCTQLLGDVEHMLGNYDSARAALEDARSWFTNIGNRNGQAACHKGLGIVYADLGQRDEAISLFTQAAEIWTAIGMTSLAQDCQRRIDSLMSLANVQ